MIGIGIIGSDPAVLIRTFHENKVIAVSLAAVCETAEPEPRRLSIHFCDRHSLIFRQIKGGIITGQGPCDISADMHLAFAGIPAFTLLASVKGRHPRIAGASGIERC